MVQGGDGHVVRDGEYAQDARGPPVLCQHGDAAVNGLLGLVDFQLFSLVGDLARAVAAETEEALHQLRALGTDETGHAQDLASADLEAGVAEALGIDGGKVLHLEDHLAGDVAPGRIEIGELPAHHLGDDEIRGQALGVPGADVLAVPHDGDLVADAEDLVHLVGDVDDGDALLAKLVNDGKEGLHLRRRQGGGGLVQNQHLAVGGHGLGDLHQLHLGDAEGAQLGLGVVIQVNLFQNRRRVLVHLFMVHGDDGPDALGGVAAHVDVLADAPLRDGLELLVDHGNAPVQRVQGTLDLDLLALVDNLALVHVVNAEHALHQCGLTRAVFSHQRVDRAGAELELGVIQGLYAGEGLDHAGHFQTIF